NLSRPPGILRTRISPPEPGSSISAPCSRMQRAYCLPRSSGSPEGEAEAEAAGAAEDVDTEATPVVGVVPQATARVNRAAARSGLFMGPNVPGVAPSELGAG